MHQAVRIIIATAKSSSSPFVSTLFGNGELGGWWDPSDLSTHTAANTGVIASIADISGNGNTLTSATGQTYNVSGGLHWIEFDGTDDYLSSQSPSLRFLGDMTIVVGCRKDNTAAFGHLMSCMTNAATINQYELRGNNGATVAMQFVSANSAAETETSTATLTEDTGAVVTLSRAIGATVTITVDDGSAKSETLAHTTIPTLDNGSTFRLASRLGSPLFLNGRIYFAMLINRLLSASELAAVKAIAAARTGVTL